MGNKHSLYEEGHQSPQQFDNRQKLPIADLLTSSNIFTSIISKDTQYRTLCDANKSSNSSPPPLPPLPSSSSGQDGKSSTLVPPLPPPPPPTTSPEVDSIAAAARSVVSYTNPGPYEQATMTCGKNIVTLDTYDGFRCDINKQLSPFMAVFHSFWVGTNMIPDGRKKLYTFMTQVADESGLLMTRVDFGRNSIDGRIHRVLLGGLCMGKLQIGVGAESSPNDQLLSELDFGGTTWTGNLKYGSMGGGIVYGMNYFQSITPNLAMGGEGMFIAANGNLLSSYMLRYQFKGYIDENDADAVAGSTNKPQSSMMSSSDRPGASTMCINFNAAQTLLSLNYKRCVTPGRVVLAGELHCNPFTLDSNVLVGAEFKLQRSKLNFCLDGTGRIQSLVEAKLGMAPGSPALTLSADVNYFTEEMRFGYGINIEG